MNQNNIDEMLAINSITSNDSIFNTSDDEIDLKAFKSLNTELDDLGYESICSLNKMDINKLLRFSLDLVHRYRRQSVTIERLQEQLKYHIILIKTFILYYIRIHMLDKENELFLKRQQNLKDSIENSSREFQISQEKNRQYEIKINEHLKINKALSDEVNFNFYQ